MIVSNMKMFLRYAPCLFSKTVFFSIFMICMVIPVNAQVINGDFEGANITGWELSGIGSTSVQFPSYGGTWGNYSLRLLSSGYPDNSVLVQTFNSKSYGVLEWDFYYSGVGTSSGDHWINVYANGDLLFSKNYRTGGGAVASHDSVNLSNYQYSNIMFLHVSYGHGCAFDNVKLTAPSSAGSSINFNPDIDFTNKSGLFFDYSLSLNDSELNTFIYSRYDPDGVNLYTFEGYTTSSFEVNVPMSSLARSGVYSIGLYYGPYGPASLVDATLIASDTIYYDGGDSYISFYGDPFYEGGVAYIDYNVQSIRDLYPDDIIRLEVAVPKADEPYYTYNVFDLVANSGRKMVDIGYKSAVYRAYDGVFAFIRVYNATSHVTLLSISEPVLNSTHEILAFSRPYYNEYDNAVLKYDLGDFYTYADPGTFTITTSFNGFLVDETDNVKVLSKHVFGELPQSEYSFFIGSLTDTNVSGVMSAQITYQDFTNSSSIPINISDLIFVSVYGAANETYPYIPEEYDPEPVYGDYPSHFLNFSSDALNITWFKAYLDSVDSTVGSFGLPVFKFFSWVVSPIVSLTSTINEFNVALEGVYDNAGVSLNAIGGAISSIYTYLPAKVLSALVLSLFFTVLLLLWKGNGGG